VATVIFHWLNPSGRNYGPTVDSSYSRYEYQGYLLGVKGTRSI